MSMLNKGGDIFTLLGIQEEKEALAQIEPETITQEEADLFLGRSKGIRPHYSHTDYDSDIQQGQNDDWNKTTTNTKTYVFLGVTC